MSPSESAYRVVITVTRALPARWRRAALVAAGGVAGTALRLAVGEWLTASPTAFPRATFVVNVAGAALLGYLLPTLLHGARSSRFTIPLLGIGVVGAFTTFSGLVVEVVELVDADRAVTALTYATASVVCGLAAALGGRWVGERRS